MTGVPRAGVSLSTVVDKRSGSEKSSLGNQLKHCSVIKR